MFVGFFYLFVFGCVCAFCLFIVVFVLLLFVVVMHVRVCPSSLMLKFV